MVRSMVTSTVEENDIGRRHNGAREGAAFKREVRNRLIEKVAFEQRFVVSKEV